MHFPKDLKGQPERQDITEKAQNGKASCCTLRKRITKLKCVNSEVNSVDIDPNWGLPQLALWHHVGVTIGITLDKNGSLY